MENDIEERELICSKLFKKVKNLEKQLETAKQEYTRAAAELKTLKRTKQDAENKSKIENCNLNLHSEWIDRQFEWSITAKKLLKDIFHFDSFRPKQLAAINATLSKKDVLLVMPTGGGKSLVYQLPALIDNGFSLIISPLISLIEDQLIALRKLGINATTVHSGTPKEQTKSVYDNMVNKKSTLKMLYVTPEWVAKSKRFMSVLKKSYEANLVARVAIGELHFMKLLYTLFPIPTP